MGKNVIDVKNLTKSYGKHRGIEDVSFIVEEGEIYGFIGPNGAGKSTTIRTLLALIHPTGGSANIFGMDCIKEAHKIARNVGYLPSEAYYYENMKVRELLKYSADLYQVDCYDRINELKEKLKLDDARKISDLSFGNKKKVGIIVALLHSPKLIILDEPTNGLDPLIKETFFEILKEENNKGATILYSSHVLSEVQRICSKVAIIKEGKIINVQDMGDLRRNGYKKIQLLLSEPITKNYFKEESIADYQAKDNQISFIYRGEADRIIEKIFNLKVEDVFIEEPTLEEIFLHYYK